MNILAIETTNKKCSVSLKKENRISTIESTDNKSHSISLFNFIKNILKENDVLMKNIDIILVSNGPGSYTGIRVGISCALGLKKSNSSKIYYIDTLYSQIFNKNFKKNCDFYISIIDAKVNRVYFAIFDKNFIQIGNDLIVDIDYMINMTNKFFKNKYTFLIIGDAVINYKKKLIEDLKINFSFIEDKYNLPSAENLICAYEKGNKNKLQTSLHINYMQKSQAERNLSIEL